MRHCKHTKNINTWWLLKFPCQHLLSLTNSVTCIGVKFAAYGKRVGGQMLIRVVRQSCFVHLCKLHYLQHLGCMFPRTKVDGQLLCMKEIHRSERRLGEEVESPPFFVTIAPRCQMHKSMEW